MALSEIQDYERELELLADITMERDMAEAWNKRLVAAVDTLLQACFDAGSPVVPTPVAEALKALKEIRHNG